MKFLHCADIHLDSPLRGLDRYEGAPVGELRGATRRAFRDLVNAAIDQAVDFVVIAGDVFDGDWPDFNTGLFFVREMGRLSEAGIRVAMVRGNHDAESQITKSLRLPDNVVVFEAGRCQTVRWDDLGVALHGRSFPDAAVPEDLAASYPAAAQGWFNLGILHTSLNGRPGHAPYAPTRADILRSKGYDYWALGHVHSREVVATTPRIVFPGNLQGRHARETGPKGCELVSVEDGEIRCESLVLDNVRWHRLAVDAAGIADDEMLLGAVFDQLKAASAEAGDRILAVRLAVTGSSALFGRLAPRLDAFEAELRALASNLNPGAWIEKIHFELRPGLDRQSAALRPDAVGEVLRLVDELGGSPADLGDLARAAFADLALKLPPEAIRSDEGLRLGEPDILARLLAEAEGLLLSKLQAEAPR
jgi:DNA repair exonuclease SbcCD nuclease subunit